MLYTKEHLRSMLPKVGDIRMEKPTEKNMPGRPIVREVCQVIEVNRDHLWYRVRFKDTGYTECYKLPEVTWRLTGGAFK